MPVIINQKKQIRNHGMFAGAVTAVTVKWSVPRVALPILHCT